MTLYARLRQSSADSGGASVIWMRPLIRIAGGLLALIKRSEAFLAAATFSSSLISSIAFIL